MQQIKICKNCKKKSNEISIFQIYWFGKYDGELLCEKCIYDKEYRKMHLNTKNILKNNKNNT